MSPYWQTWLQYPQQVFIAADQLLNALIPPWGGTLSFADETLSARSYRAHTPQSALQASASADSAPIGRPTASEAAA